MDEERYQELSRDIDALLSLINVANVEIGEALDEQRRMIEE